jgi:hypothetical protein
MIDPLKEFILGIFFILYSLIFIIHLLINNKKREIDVNRKIRNINVIIFLLIPIFILGILSIVTYIKTLFIK